MHKIAVIPGDGIGTEVVEQALRVLERLVSKRDLPMEWTSWDLGAERYLRDGLTITEEEFRSLEEDYDAILLGALGDPRVPDNVHARDILLGLRFRLDLFINFRPCRLLDARFSPLKNLGDEDIHLDIFRENTEGPYVNAGGALRAGTPEEIALQEDINTFRGVERIVRAAFEYAREKERSRVTMVDKANAMPVAGALWRRVFEEVGSDYGELERDVMYVDAMAMDLVRRPREYSVVVTSNLFGDILSDLAAEITGGLGLAPSANRHPGKSALYEPVHGSAPDIAGSGRANPLAAIRCVGLLLDDLGFSAEAVELETAVADSLREGVTTEDLGGSASTSEVGGWICEQLYAG